MILTNDDHLALQEKLFPATMMLDQDWWHALWPDPGRVLNCMSVAQTQSFVEQAGFELEALVELPLYHYGTVCRKVVM
ncbi:MAG: hypothetical protein ACYCSS_11095 [Sulfuriferula sp.]